MGRHAPSGTIANKIRQFARQQNTSITFIGSENAGRLSNSLSVGSTISCELSYDVLIVSEAQPTKIKQLEESIPTKQTIEKEQQQPNTTKS